MTPIFKPTGEIYCWVGTDSGLLQIKFNSGSAKGHTVNLDEKIIPDLIEILTLLQQAGVEE
jgi:hypothetical protein